MILVVDDELPLRQIMQQTLEAFGYGVILARDGTEAVAIYTERRTEIAAVLTDMTMPGMDGLGLIRDLRSQNPSLPIIAASGLALDYAARLASLGVTNVLAKPYRTAVLLKMVKHVLAGEPAARPD